MSDVKFAVFGHLRMFSKKPKIFTERYQLRAAPPYGKDTKNKLTKKKGRWSIWWQFYSWPLRCLFEAGTFRV